MTQRKKRSHIDFFHPVFFSFFFLFFCRTFIFQLDQEFKDTRPVISSLEHRHPNVAHYHSTVESTRGNRYVLMEHKEGMMTLRDFIKSRKEPDQKTKNLIFSGIVHGAQYLYEYKIVVKNLCPSTIMIHEHDLVPIIFDFRFARSEDRPFTTRPEKEECTTNHTMHTHQSFCFVLFGLVDLFHVCVYMCMLSFYTDDYYKDCLYDDEWEYLFCMRVILFNVFCWSVGSVN